MSCRVRNLNIRFRVLYILKLECYHFQIVLLACLLSVAISKPYLPYFIARGVQPYHYGNYQMMMPSYNRFFWPNQMFRFAVPISQAYYRCHNNLGAEVPCAGVAPVAPVAPPAVPERVFNPAQPQVPVQVQPQPPAQSVPAEEDDFVLVGE